MSHFGVTFDSLARLRGRAVTERSEKVLGRVLGKGSQLKRSEKGSQASIGEYAPSGVRPI